MKGNVSEEVKIEVMFLSVHRKIMHLSHLAMNDAKKKRGIKKEEDHGQGIMSVVNVREGIILFVHLLLNQSNF